VAWSTSARESGEKIQYIIREMPLRVRAGALLALLLAVLAGSACGTSLFGRQYEYEEDVYLSTDGSADLILNASIPALVALRGLDLDLDADAPVDRDRIRDIYTTPVSSVMRVSRPWRRNGRRYVQIRVRVDDIRRLHEAPPFAWSEYSLDEKDGARVYRQVVGASSFRPGTMTNVGWTGGELVAFRLHLPSRVLEHNARDVETDKPLSPGRGNILRWEQPLTDRLDGQPVRIEVRMDTDSILHTTLWLFAGAFAAAMLLIAALIWFTFRKGAREPEAGVQHTP
jgi:hypothetical protein